MLPDNGLLILSGEPKIGKTTLMTYVGICISHGWPAFGTIPINRKYKFLFLALEDSDQLMKRRLTQIYSNEPTYVKWSKNFTYITEFPNMKQDGLTYLDQLIDYYNPESGLLKNGCCYPGSCEHLTSSGCGVKALGCKLVACSSYINERNGFGEFRDKLYKVKEEAVKLGLYVPCFWDKERYMIHLKAKMDRETQYEYEW